LRARAFRGGCLQWAHGSDFGLKTGRESEWKTIGARSFRALHFKPPQEIRGCQVLFIGAEEKKLLPAILAGVKGNSVLTVGESEHFAEGGGMIGFLLEENKIRFEINLEAAKKAKLKISSKLLVLAKTVIGSQGGT
jgi:hypothetical protein